MQEPVERSRVHRGSFPHPADCRLCHYENRCALCGNSRGYTGKQRMRHGVGRCTASHPREQEAKQDRVEVWLLGRIRDTRHERPLCGSGACGFATIDELRAFAYSEATGAIGRDLNVIQRMQLELAVRTLYRPLAFMSAAIEVQHA